MKKILVLSVCLFAMIVISNAQDIKPLPPPKVDLTKFVPPTKEQQAFYKQNPEVARLYWKSEKDIVVLHKNKARFTYNMKNDKEKAAFKEKYGNMALTVPPPPPPAPPPPPLPVDKRS